MNPTELWQKAREQLRPVVRKLGQRAQAWQTQATDLWQPESVQDWLESAQRFGQQATRAATTWKTKAMDWAKQQWPGKGDCDR